MPIKNINGQVTDTATTPTGHPAGQRYERFNTTYQCEEVWLYVKNGEASTAWAQGNPIIRKADTRTCIGILGTAGTNYPLSRVLGVAQSAVAAGSYGWIMQRGFGEVLMGSNNDVTADAPITTGGATTAGTAKLGTVGTDEAFAYSTDEVGANALTTSFIFCNGN